MFFILALFFFFMFLPRVIFFGLGFFANVLPFLLVAAITNSVSDAYGDRAKWCKAADEKADAKTEQEEEPAVVCDVATTPHTHIDDNKITWKIAAPGISSKALDVRVLDDHVLRVSGETKKGGGVYRIHRNIELPPVDMDTMTAKLED